MARPLLGRAGQVPVPAQSQSWKGATNAITHTGGAFPTNTVTYCLFDVGPRAETFDAIGINLSVLPVGGSVSYRAAVNYDNGSGGKPGNVITGSDPGDFTLTALGLTFLTFASVLTLQPGRCWLAFRYLVATAPTTAPNAFQIASCVGLPSNGATTLWTAGLKGWSASGQTAGVMPNAPAGIALVSSGIASVALRAA